jgi:hypothetical protein
MTLTSPRDIRQFVRDHPTGVVVALAFVAAVISLVIRAEPRFDPEGWLRWGRELGWGSGSFTTADYPSWKPLPVLFTVPLSFTGPAAPILWLLIARIAGLLALPLVFRVSRDLAGTLAGVVAVVALVLIPGWWPTVFGGQVEPMLLTLALLAYERHRAGHAGTALLLGTLVALGREEAWPLLVLYGIWCVREDKLPAWPVWTAALAVPALWLGGDWIGSGSPVHGGQLARQATDAVVVSSRGSAPVYVSGLVAGLFVLPLWAAIVTGAGSAWRRRRGPELAFALAAFTWLSIDLTLAALGYLAQVRFLLPAAGCLAILAGVGVVRLLEIRRAPFLRPVALAMMVAAGPSAVMGAVTPPPHIDDGPVAAKVDAANRRARAMTLPATVFLGQSPKTFRKTITP